MTRLSKKTTGLAAAAIVATSLVVDAPRATAQCATCATPTVAYSPVAYSPVVVQPAPVVRTGWYPGYLLDRMRMRRWSAAAPTYAAAPAYSVGYAPAYNAAYAPTYTAAYAPSYTAAYAPAATYTAGYAPYITAYAPLQQPVVQTSYMPAVSASPCTGCAQSTTVSYAPSTVYRPVEVTPIVTSVVAAPACSACSVEAPCGGCSSCSAGVSQASYVESSPVASDCPSCAASAGEPYYRSSVPGQSGVPTGPATPQPALTPDVAEPTGRVFGAQRPDTTGTTNDVRNPEDSVVDPKPEADDAAVGPEVEIPEPDASTSYEFQAPPLIAPQNDRTANRPTVDVHHAVYSSPVRHERVSTTAAKVDATGWYSVSDRN